MKAKDRAKLKAMILYPSRFVECCQENFTYNIAFLHYKLLNASDVLYMLYRIYKTIVII